MLQQDLVNRQELVQEQRKKTLLVVDDEPIICQLCARALTNFEVIQANDGRQALQQLYRHEVDIILSDVMMPNMSGLDLLRTVKQQQPDLAIILMTGYTDKEVILQALKAGADDFISKPINLLQLRTTVDKVLDKVLMRKELASLKQIDKLKTDFLGLVSHKLKTPATAISLFVQHIAAGIDDPEAESFKKTLSMIQAETMHLEHLIQDLLYFSNVILQEDQLKLQPIELGKIARQVATSLELVASNKNIDLQVNLDLPFPPKPMELDRERISFAIRALLDNAIKFTPEGGSVSLEGSLSDNLVRLQIRDTGCGIPPEELAKIFNKFYQVDKENTGQIRGFGLGLFYARDFVRKLGGKLQIDSQPSLGTIATIEFPLAE
ncbi:cell wall metabolism sensor histidine kinase WalK [Malonomonas rubra]|uniref:sensor histidine kinase n=1 Tax=Malonomonas rubra TaxID=57040 RepID=UPI0026EBF443|nr:response regulator [Malonomonas rubra]